MTGSVDWESAFVREYKEMLVSLPSTWVEDQIRWQDLRDSFLAVPVATEADELNRAEREGIVRGVQDSPAASGE